MSAPTYAIIVPVWGAAHVARFLDWALPSWLSAQNLPHLAAGACVELFLLAPKADIIEVSRHPTTALLEKYCTLKPVEIDDLIPGDISTVTLTLAFTRGASAAMARERRPRLIFLNADFLLTDGSIASIARRFDTGQRLLLSASIRVREELVLPDLARMRSDGSMIVPAREAVRLALGALHPTVLACRVDQPLLQSAHPNQFFWQPDANTLLLRAFLLFPLAVSPDHPPGLAETYCDYGWITTFAPDAPVDIIDTSDELFIVELAPSSQEVDFVRPGPFDAEEAARRISVWANDFSRAQPLTPVIFNAIDVSEASRRELTARSGDFIKDLSRRLGPAQPMANHPYWLGGAAAYLRNRRRAGLHAVPAELAAPKSLPMRNFALGAWLRSLAKDMLMGRPGKRLPWHPYWRAERLLKGLGAVRVVGHGRIADAYGVTTLSSGTALGAIDVRSRKLSRDAVASLAANVAMGDRAFLIVDHGADRSATSLTIGERIDALAAVDQVFRIRSARALVTSLEAKVAARHRRLAAEMHLESPGRLLGLIVGSAVALVEMAFVNTWDGIVGLSIEPIDAAALILELERHPR
jgi:hypothetical protein